MRGTDLGNFVDDGLDPFGIGHGAGNLTTNILGIVIPGLDPLANFANPRVRCLRCRLQRFRQPCRVL